MRQRARRTPLGPYFMGGAATWNLTNIGGSPEAVADHFGVNLVWVGSLIGVIFLAQALFQIPGGYLIERFGPRRIGMCCLALIVLCNLGILVSPSFATAFALRFATGVGSGIAFVAAASCIGRVGGTALAQGMYGGVSVGAGGIAVGSVAWLSGVLGWRAPFESAAVAAAIALLIMLRTPEGMAPPAVRMSKVLPSILLDRRVWRYSVIQAATFGLSVLASNWLVLLLMSEKGHSRELGGAVAALVLLGGTVGRPLGGWLLLRSPARQGSLIAVALLVTALSVPVLTFVDFLPAVIASTAVFGLAVGVPFGALFAGVIETRPDAPSLALGVMSTPGMVLIMVGTPLMGAAFSVLGDGRIGFVVIGLLVAGSICAVPRHEARDATALTAG